MQRPRSSDQIAVLYYTFFRRTQRITRAASTRASITPESRVHAPRYSCKAVNSRCSVSQTSLGVVQYTGAVTDHYGYDTVQAYTAVKDCN